MKGESYAYPTQDIDLRDSSNTPPLTQTPSPEKLFQELECKPSSDYPSSYRCQVFPGFISGKWEHEDVNEFAGKIVKLISPLLVNSSFKNYHVEVQGAADAMPPKNSKTWEADVAGKIFYGSTCPSQGRTGSLSNADFAWLRACSVINAINIISPLHKAKFYFQHIDLVRRTFKNSRDEMSYINKHTRLEDRSAAIFLIPNHLRSRNQ